MTKRLHQAVTLSLLVFFTVENMLPAAIESHADKFSTVDRLATPTEHCNVFSWILEENETEERDDTKGHGEVICIFISFLHSHEPEVALSLSEKSILAGSQKLLKMIHLLRI